MARDLTDLDVAALMLDGFNFGAHCWWASWPSAPMGPVGQVVAGAPSPAGRTGQGAGRLWLGDTENDTVVHRLCGL